MGSNSCFYLHIFSHVYEMIGLLFSIYPGSAVVIIGRHHPGHVTHADKLSHPCLISITGSTLNPWKPDRSPSSRTLVIGRFMKGESFVSCGLIIMSISKIKHVLYITLCVFFYLLWVRKRKGICIRHKFFFAAMIIHFEKTLS